MFVSEDYRRSLESSNPGIIDRFLEALRDVLGNLYQQVTGQPLTYKDETFNAVYDMLKNRKVEKPKSSITEESINAMEDLLRKESKKDDKPPMPPTDLDSKRRLPEIKNCK